MQSNETTLNTGNMPWLTPAWLTPRLNDIRGDAQVQSIRATNIGEGIGFGGEVYRLTLQYDGETSAPNHVVLKLPVAAPEMLAGIKAQGMFREARFYKELAPTLPEHLQKYLPIIYHVDIDEAASSFTILMEDLSTFHADAQRLSKPDDVAPGVLRAAVTAMAEFHAAFWNSEILHATANQWLSPMMDNTQTSRVTNQTSLKRALDRLVAAGVDDKVLLGCTQGLIKLVMNAPDTLPQSRPVTLVHGDFHADNLFVNGGDIRIFDWQLVARGSPLLDVANLLASSVSPDKATRDSVDLVQAYYQALLDNGVKTYSQKSLQKDLLQAQFFTFLKFLIIFGTVSYAGRNGARLKSVAIDRLVFLARESNAKTMVRKLGILFFLKNSTARVRQWFIR